MNNKERKIPSVTVTYSQSGQTQTSNELGMRPMQSEAYKHRGEQYLLIKSPPASGKSRALMFIALDKLANQGLQQAIICVPEQSIGASFNNEPLSDFGFWADWEVKPNRNLCNASGTESGSSKIKAVGDFLQSEDKVLVCTHATFRFAVEKYGIEAFDNRLLAVDEFHHVSADEDNILGRQLNDLIERDKTHLVAMTGSYFRGDANPILSPEHEVKFDVVTYTYYQQLNGYQYLKNLNIGYYFYSGSYVDDILKVLDPNEKTILHIPNVNSRESTKDKTKELEQIIDALGVWKGKDEVTGFQMIEQPDGRILKVADLVDDDPQKRNKVITALKSDECNANRDFVDIIIALGMAKEGFDWIWCEHALTVGYRASLTEVVQIIGRATRDAPGKSHARFTNLIAEPDASEQSVTEAVNDTLKAISASLLMEQVLAPKFEFRAKNPGNKPDDDYDYGEEKYDPNRTNVGVNPDNGNIQVEIDGLIEPKSDEAKRVCEEDLQDVISSFIQDTKHAERGMFDENKISEELTQSNMAKIVRDRYPHLDNEDQEAIRQRAVAAMILVQKGGASSAGESENVFDTGISGASGQEGATVINNAFVKGVRRFAMDVRNLDIDLIDSINPFGEAYSILAQTMNEDSLKEISSVITAKREAIDSKEAEELARRAIQFKADRGNWPSATSQDPWERRMKAGIDAFMRYKNEGRYDG